MSTITALVGVAVAALAWLLGPDTARSGGGGGPPVASATVTPISPAPSTAPSTSVPSTSVPELVSLSALEPTQADVAYVQTNQTATIGGRVLLRSVLVPVTGRSERPSLTYSLDRRFTALRGTVGLADNSTSTAGVFTVTFVGDGRTIASIRFSFGQARQVDVKLNKVSQLQITFAGTADPCCAIVALGDVSLVEV